MIASKPTTRPWIPALTVLFAATLGFASCQRGQAQPTVEPARPPVPPAAVAEVSLADGFAPVLERVKPAVVNINATRVVRTPDREMPFFFGPFDWDAPRERRQRGQGSGVIVSPDGLILTNNHVVQDATDVRVSLADRREFRARVVGTDPPTDLAVLRIDARDLPHLPFGDSGAVRVGEFALAIGNPFGLGQTVTMGIVSAVGRGNVGIVDYEDFIQTDAAINPGNSGGALVNHRGELIGINTAIVSAGAQGNQGIGFAVPSEMARSVMERILRDGRVVRGWLGVYIQEVTPAMGRALGLDEARGALVGDVVAGGPAERAGLRRGDVVVELDGRRVEDGRGLRMRIAQAAPGSRARLRVLRDGKSREVTATLGELPEDPRRASREPRSAASDLLGLQVAPLGPAALRQLDLPPGTTGVVVTAVAPASRAADAGLRRGDVIQEANRRPLASPADLAGILREAGEDAVLLLVLRGGATQYVLLEPR